MSYFLVKLVHLQENFRLQHENRKCPLINTYYFRLWISTKDRSVTIFKGVLLSRYAFVEQRDGTFKCWILFSVKGKYKFEVFNKPTNDDVKYSEVLSFLHRSLLYNSSTIVPFTLFTYQVRNLSNC